MSAIAMGPQVRTAPARRAAEGRAVRDRAPRATMSAASVPRDAADMRGLVLTRRGRLIVLLVAVALAVIALLAGGRALADAPASSQRVVEHVVERGETLWAIAAESVAPGESVRAAVTELVRMNNLPSAEVMAGQTVLVPQG
ncbi:MAG TPA: LysM peptidoglycan-binding domain-containing protein [Cellulomonas sp.]|nr:LysM peptidoglycan-binding domain-containing protein [Cellulomonas sp.]